MTEREAVDQLLQGAPPSTSIGLHHSAMDGATVVTAYLLGQAVEVGRIVDSIHHDPRGFVVDWPAVLRALQPAPTALQQAEEAPTG